MRIRLFLGLTAALLLFSFSACSSGYKKELSLPDVPLENIVAVSVESNIGNILFEPGSGSFVKIKPTVMISAGERERRRAIEESVLVTTDTSDPSLLTIISRVGNAVTLKESESVTIDLVVQIPAEVKRIVVQSGTGDISFDKVNCAVSVVNNSGSVNVTNSVFTGKSSITNVVGDVSVKLKGIDAAQEITVGVDVGDISFNVPKRSSYTVTVEELSNKGDTWKNKDGTTRLLLSTKVGKISFQK